MSKTRINLYLDESIGEAFKRYCRSKKKSYSEIAEGLFYRLLSTPHSSSEASTLNVIQEQIHHEAVQAYRDVYKSNRQSIIDSAVSSSGSESVEEVSPQIPMPIPTSPEVNYHERPRRLSKREKRS